MNRGRTRTSGLFALAMGVVVTGCGSSSGGSDGDGFGGAGGAGGAETAMLRVAHLAPDVPAAGATEVDITIVDEGSLRSFSFGRVSAYTTLPTGLHTLRVTEPVVGGELLASITPELELDGWYTVIAFRDSREAGEMSLMLVEESTVGLATDSGRIVVGHVADDSSWAAVNVVDSDTDEVLAANLGFGERSEPSDQVAGQYSLGFDVSPPSPMIDEGPFRVNVDAEQPSILVVVDNDTADESVDAAVYAIGSDTAGLITPLPRE